MAEKVLSIFFDESGDQGLSGNSSPFYIFAMVFHDQSKDITWPIRNLDNRLLNHGANDLPIHAGPLIRREFPYENMQMETRKKIFTTFLDFMRKTEVDYGAVSFEKKIACSEQVGVAAAIDGKLKEFFLSHHDYFGIYAKVIAYYDNGQKYLSNVIEKNLSLLPTEAELRKIDPAGYRLAQAADMVCTMELLRIKAESSILTPSESDFFGGMRKLKKDYLRKFDTGFI